ncbi:uncharacterized protein F5147DRAFT_647089 [Suillus discolor]|uniref:Uncharacterized protein n=1 Tax=Suillus discolor TaxID=1912936 RepID=A0A9P7FJN2_9AGAM|nr:uncharacterized protein F5147DRAFT_647089 [Suillus discolor]KAG2120629.1 hypothetical protein F5147DRAFT_647089 [Suillus discolor]
MVELGHQLHTIQHVGRSLHGPKPQLWADYTSRTWFERELDLLNTFGDVWSRTTSISYSEHTQDPGEMHLSGVVITDLTLGLRQIPTDFHAIVKADSTEYQTMSQSTATSTRAPALLDSRRSGTPPELRTTAVQTAGTPPLA